MLIHTLKKALMQGSVTLTRHRLEGLVGALASAVSKNSQSARHGSNRQSIVGYAFFQQRILPGRVY